MASDSALIDEEVFSETFIPERLVCRESQIKEIARCIAPARSGKSIRNLFVYGPPGVGKTTVCRWLTENLSKKSVYINCWSKRTSHKIWVEIFSQLGLIGWNDRESTSELVKRFEKSGKKVIVCLDEADQLKETEILYVLARNSCGVILISNTTSFLSSIDERVRGSLFLADIEFKPYSKEEILEILQDRLSYGIRPGGINQSLLNVVSSMARGDARIGLQIVKAAAKDAESRGLEAISIEEIKAAAKCARKYRLSYLLGKLNVHQRVVYTILKNTKAMNSGDLYFEYCKSTKEPVVDRAYRKHMKRMEELGLIKSEGSGRWKRFEVV